ncbi:MAG: TonB-dependent receptor [Bacteroidota bacterium]
MIKIKRLYIKIGLFCSLFLLFAFVPKADDPIDKLVAALQKWTDTYPQEKVYLHMDKPYYALGDTIWFKGYITIGSRHQLSKLSGALHVDFITDQDSVIRSLKLPIISGMVVGEFNLSDDFKEGSYRIRAYTQWMLNAGDEYFFDKTFTVGSIGSNVVAKADYQYKTVNNKPILTAVLNYTDDDGRALAERSIKYQIVIDKTVMDTKVTKTDALGSLMINIANDKRANLSGAYIRTIIEDKDKQPVIRDFPIKAGLVQSDVQFFPESGNLVAGVSSRVAFKAIGVDGTGTPIKGSVVDQANAEVAQIETLHAGMGNFLMRPEAGKTYTAKISFADGSTKTVALPKVVDEGYVLGVYQPNKDSILVRIGASANMVAAGQDILFIAQTSGETIFATPVKIAKASTSIWLEKKSFPSGIAQFNLFDANGQPLNERVAFIRSNDVMQLLVKSSKATYKAKEPIAVSLEAKDSKGAGIPGNFSVAVIDETKVPGGEDVESTIFSNLLLTSDLKGYIEKPNYYFAKQGDEVDRALDNLMLTQGYSRFTWNKLPVLNAAKPAYEPEDLGVKISGKVYKLASNSVIAGATVDMISIRAGINKTATTDAEGRFSFGPILLQDSIKFAVQAKNGKSDKVKIMIDTLPKVRIGINPNFGDVSTNVSATLSAYLQNLKKQDEFYEKTGQLDKVQRLREVRIKAKRAKAESNLTPQGMFQIPEVSADKVVRFSEYEADMCLNLSMCLQARLPGVRVESNLGYTTMTDLRGSKLVLILDGRKITSADEVSEILEGSVPPTDVAKILLVRTNEAIKNTLGGDGAGYILIITKLGTARKLYIPNIANVTPKGFNKVREFYMPKYTTANATQADLRTTIYWDPRIKTDANGKTAFTYFNADGPGTYKVVVEGINAAGELGRQVYRYTVK